MPENHAYSQERRLTKVYMLKPAVATILNEFWRADGGALVFDVDTEERLTHADFPPNGILRSSHSQVSVPSIVPVDLAKLNSTIAREEEGMDAAILGIRHRRAFTLRALYLTRQ